MYVVVFAIQKHNSAIWKDFSFNQMHMMHAENIGTEERFSLAFFLKRERKIQKTDRHQNTPQ